MFSTICMSWLINRNLGKSSQDQRRFSHLKPGYHHWTPPIVHLQHPYFCEEPHWWQWTQQRAHRNHRWSRYDLLVVKSNLLHIPGVIMYNSSVHITLSSYFWYLKCIGQALGLLKGFFIHRTNSNANTLLMFHFLLNCSIGWHREATMLQYCQLVVKVDITGEGLRYW